MKSLSKNVIASSRLLRLYWLFVVFTVGSIGLAMLTTQDTRWMQWHLSRLGEGTLLPAAVFNFCVCIIGILAFLLAYCTAAFVRSARPTENVSLFLGVFAVIMVQLFGVAAFPYDRFPQIHDFFGYGLFFVCVIFLLFLHFVAPFLSKRTKISALVIAIFAGSPMIFYQFFGIGTLLGMELYGIFWIFILLFIGVRDVAHMKHA